MEFIEARTSQYRGATQYVVEAADGLHFYRSPAQANAEFPGAFDEPDTDE